jgi:ABC-2 type transport system permease protein
MVRFRILCLKEIHRFVRVLGQTLLAPVINALLYLLIFGVSLGRHVELGVGVPYLSYLIPGLVMMGVLNNAFQNSASSLMISKYHGDLEDLKVTPLNSHHIVWAMSFASLIRGTLVGTAIFLAGECFFYTQNGQFLPVAHPAWLLMFLGVGGLAFGQVGLIIGFLARTFDEMNTFSAFIILPLIYLGGVFFTLRNVHPIWMAVSRANPLLYFVNGVRYAIIDYADVTVLTSASVCIAFLIACTAGCYVAVAKGAYRRF